MSAVKEVLPKIVKEFGNTRLVFDVALMTPEMQDKVKDVLADLRSKDSIYVRMPAKINQDHKEYLMDAELSDPELMRREDESPEEHAKRIMTPRMKSADEAFETLNALIPLFNQPELPRHDFNKVAMHETRTFLFNILNFLDCPVAQDFVPKRIVDGRSFR